MPIVSLQGVPTPYGGFSILVLPNEVKLHEEKNKRRANDGKIRVFKETSAGGCNDLGL